MKAKLAAGLMLALTAGGCSVYDVRDGAVEDNRARLVIKNAESDAVLMVNGETIGRAAYFDSESNAFRLSQGNYLVAVRVMQTEQLVQTVFATDGTTEILYVPDPVDRETVAPQ